MKFFFPDAHDYVDPDFDFESECSRTDRERYRSDRYAHEIFERPPYDGLLISKSIVDGAGTRAGKYTVAQRHRLRRAGAHRFFRVEHLCDEDGCPFPIMGDCGAFSYASEPRPPITVDEATDFYEACGFTHAQSVDHVIREFNETWDHGGLFPAGPPKDVQQRFDITLALAEDFLREHRRRGCNFIPVGVAQGWSPASYGRAVDRLQSLGYDYIALGGLVPLRSSQFIEVVRTAMAVAKANVRIHLLGVLRWEHMEELLELGVASVDSTSPLRQAFLDSKNNYYTSDPELPAYTAVRVPQMDGNARLKRRILAGAVDLDAVRRLEAHCMASLQQWEDAQSLDDLDTLLDDLDRYGSFMDPRGNYRATNRRILIDRPWTRCACAICQDIGIHVALFRGANRNRRRGFHNLYVTYERLQAVQEACKSKFPDRALNIG